MKASARVACLATALVLLCSGLGLTQLAKSHAVTVIADNQTRQVTSTARSVGEALIELGITLGDRDRTSPSLSAALTDGMTVRVTRIKYSQVVEQVPVRAKATVLAAPNAPAGYMKILSDGQDGVVKRVTEVWEKDGQVTQRNVLREKVVVRAKPAVIMRGTLGEASRGGDWHKPIRMVATGYVGGACGGSASGRTASGLKARRGVAAVDTRLIPLGTRLYVPNYGFVIAADRGSAIRGNRIDLCFDTYHEATHFGRRTVHVYVLK